MLITVIFLAVFTTVGLGNLLDQVWIKTEASGFVNASSLNMDYTVLSFFQLYPANDKYMKFTVKACSNAIIILSNDMYLRSLLFDYRIVIGADNNSKLYFRRNYDLVISSFDIGTPGILNCTEHRSFELNWTISGRITLMSGTKMVMNYTDPSPTPFSINDVGITTGLGSVGLWKVEHTCKEVKSLLQKAREMNVEIQQFLQDYRPGKALPKVGDGIFFYNYVDTTKGITEAERDELTSFLSTFSDINFSVIDVPIMVHDTIAFIVHYSDKKDFAKKQVEDQ